MASVDSVCLRLIAASHLPHSHVGMCATVSKRWNQIFSSQQVWKSLCILKFKAACDLVSRSLDSDTPFYYTKLYNRLDNLMRHDRLARPEIDVSLLDAILEIQIDRMGDQSEKEEISFLRINGFTLADENSMVQPAFQTCILRGTADELDADLAERLKGNSTNCSLRAHLLNRSNGKLAMLHVDSDTGSAGMGADFDFSADEVRRAPSLRRGPEIS